MDAAHARATSGIILRQMTKEMAEGEDDPRLEIAEVAQSVFLLYAYQVGLQVALAAPEYAEVLMNSDEGKAFIEEQAQTLLQCCPVTSEEKLGG
ncbi:hypothetical protein LCGC14_1326160 [marine sediment metagenome]|uniref:Uncharacterized protein n=1 Tax=marine sediment metagenome TaxID=412755 RepID=A0A0F9MZ25_9ZZZZ